MRMAQVNAGIDLIISLFAGIGSGYFTLNFMLASMKISKSNAQKREEGKDHLEHIILGIVIFVAAKAMATFFLNRG